MDFKLEVVVLPVTDVDRTKDFYKALGWREDNDVVRPGGIRGVQFTPPGSGTSIQFGIGLTDAVPGSVRNTYLVVSDVEAARAELVERGFAVSEVFHFDASRNLTPGPNPDRASYTSFAQFSDPDGNTWRLQEITHRLPGRVTGTAYGSASDLAEAMRRAEEAHGKYEATLGHRDDDWPTWYARYMQDEQAS
jgi:catechol 2,3-dioxygenase-like lactoylglutathione lyase family enzyme